MDEDDEVMDVEAVVNNKMPIMWTRKLTTRLLNEFKRLAPKVGDSIKNLNMLHAVICKTLTSEYKCDLTPSQVGNKLKSIKRKYTLYKEKGRSVAEFGSGLEDVIKLMDMVHYNKCRKSISSAADQSIMNESNEPPYSIEIIDESLQNGGEIMDIAQFLTKREREPSTPSHTLHQDPLEGDIVDFSEKSRSSDAGKLSLLEKKIANQEKSLEERLRKNELIEERNRLIGTLLAKKTRSDVVDAIRRDRVVHHNEMRDLWIERLEVERKKLDEKKRKNDLLEERNALMKALLQGMNKTIGQDSSRDDDRKSQPSEEHHTIELE